MCTDDVSGAVPDNSTLLALASGPTRLAQLLADLGEDAAHRRPSPEEWCVVEVVVHLGDVEPRYRARLERIASEDNPQVPAIWPRPMPDPLPPPDEALAYFRDERTRTVDFLSTLEAGAWDRRAHHATLGATTLLEQVRNLIEHDDNHLHQIVQAIETIERR